MADLRAKRIRAGAIITLISVVAMLVLAMFTCIQPSDYEPKSFRDEVSHMKIRHTDLGATAARRKLARQRLDDTTYWRGKGIASGLLERGQEMQWHRGDLVVYGYFPYSFVFLVGMAYVTIGGILLIVGLTTKAGIP